MGLTNENTTSFRVPSWMRGMFQVLKHRYGIGAGDIVRAGVKLELEKIMDRIDEGELVALYEDSADFSEGEREKLEDALELLREPGIGRPRWWPPAE